MVISLFAVTAFELFSGFTNCCNDFFTEGAKKKILKNKSHNIRWNVIRPRSEESRNGRKSGDGQRTIDIGTRRARQEASIRD